MHEFVNIFETVELYMKSFQAMYNVITLLFMHFLFHSFVKQEIG